MLSARNTVARTLPHRLLLSSGVAVQLLPFPKCWFALPGVLLYRSLLPLRPTPSCPEGLFRGECLGFVLYTLLIGNPRLAGSSLSQSRPPPSGRTPEHTSRNQRGSTLNAYWPLPVGWCLALSLLLSHILLRVYGF